MLSPSTVATMAKATFFCGPADACPKKLLYKKHILQKKSSINILALLPENVIEHNKKTTTFCILSRKLGWQEFHSRCRLAEKKESKTTKKVSVNWCQLHFYLLRVLLYHTK